jgi:CRISPR-associated protein Cmr3
MLVTPALFERGWLPGWLDESLQGSPPGHARLKLRLCAASLERWQPFSGWDLQSRNRHSAGAARAIRRMVPSGSLYWFKVLEGDADTIAKLWLSPVSDQEQDRRDGFGLAAPGVWSTCP